MGQQSYGSPMESLGFIRGQEHRKQAVRTPHLFRQPGGGRMRLHYRLSPRSATTSGFGWMSRTCISLAEITTKRTLFGRMGVRVQVLACI